MVDTTSKSINIPWPLLAMTRTRYAPGPRSVYDASPEFDGRFRAFGRSGGQRAGNGGQELAVDRVVHTRRTTCLSSPGGISFSEYTLAPASRARRASTSSSNVVGTIILAAGNSARIASVLSIRSTPANVNPSE
jgi:hypothetical protein